MSKHPSSNKLHFAVINNDITDIKAEAVVTGEGPWMNRNSAVTKSLEAVIPKLKVVRSQLKDQHHRLDLWTAHVSSLGSDSRFQYVIHAVLDKGNNGQWLRFMKMLYKNIFKEADKPNITTIALPVLGSGTSDSDRAFSVEALVTSLLAYSPSYLTLVKVVTYDQDLYDMVKEQFKCKESSGYESSTGFVTKFLTNIKDTVLPSSYYDASKDTLQNVLNESKRKEQKYENKSQMVFEQYSVHASVTTGVQDENITKGALQQFDRTTASADKYQYDCLQDIKTMEGHPDLKLAAKGPNSPSEDSVPDETPSTTSVNDIQMCIYEEDNPRKSTENIESSTDQVNDVNKANEQKHDAQENARSELDDHEKNLSTGDSSNGKHLEGKGTDDTSDDLKKCDAPENYVDCCTEDNDKTGDSKTDSIRTCPICLYAIMIPKKLDKCGHVFCEDCIDQCFRDFKPVCPSCNMVYGVITGNQPEGNMDVGFNSQSLPGYAHHGTITITYSFPSGIQKEGHPYPGNPYKGTTRRAYLPDCTEGRDILDLLRTAFDRKLTFTVGRSTTTGQENVVTWNDIHHKTNMKGGPTRFGYPDQTYLGRVRDELASKGVTTQ